jgi:superkiller protein 3
MNRNTKQDYLYGMQLCYEAIELDPTFAVAYDHIGQCCLNIYQMYDRDPEWLKKAERSIDKAMKLKPSDPINYSILAILYLRQGKGAEAVEAAKKGISLDPKKETSYFQLGYIYDGIHEYRSAAEAYEQSLAMNPQSLDTHANVCLDYYRLGDQDNLVKAAERALPHFQKYLATHPDDQNKRQRYATTLYYLGRKDECFNEIESLLKLPGIDGKTYYNCACRYAVDGREQRAFEILFKALDEGFADYELIMTDPDLNSLRGTEMWFWLMKKIDERHMFAN